MFELHERLAADCVAVTDWPLSRVLLMNDCSYPWLILVPRRHGVTELHELDSGDRVQLMEEIADASRRLQNLTHAPKINIAALGNVVPQLHVHVIARFHEDDAWPRPVWGTSPIRRYGGQELAQTVARLVAAMTAT
ncbi:HIT domain-containing protein [Magnetospirillum sp. UT-4]|uniref:HIT domain-containing protein n=1 Tax=Magnetospirillum sp. UT-4 TaxID=2681467 RepID=UPI00137F5C3B|nr:HIT family protein [Magnetospirillum sp. UT-4]CAA7619781.1 Histidine triad (HIT) protein [Magnetospirillum sp. UT-4]